MKNESQRVAAIRARYKDSLVEKADQVAAHLNVLAENQDEWSEWFDPIHQDLHKLAGSSGMYGYSDISDLAQAAMRDLDARDVNALMQTLHELQDLLRRYA